MSRITRRTIIPVNQITPLTYRDGVTYIQMLSELSDYVKSVLHPSLQHTVDQIVADVEAQMDKHHDQYVDGVQEFQRIHDAFMSDVHANLTALNDTAVSDLLADTTSLLYQSVVDNTSRYIRERHRTITSQEWGIDPTVDPATLSANIQEFWDYTAEHGYTAVMLPGEYELDHPVGSPNSMLNVPGNAHIVFRGTHFQRAPYETNTPATSSRILRLGGECVNTTLEGHLSIDGAYRDGLNWYSEHNHCIFIYQAKNVDAKGLHLIAGNSMADCLSFSGTGNSEHTTRNVWIGSVELYDAVRGSLIIEGTVDCGIGNANLDNMNGNVALAYEPFGINANDRMATFTINTLYARGRMSGTAGTTPDQTQKAHLSGDHWVFTVPEHVERQAMQLYGMNLNVNHITIDARDKRESTTPLVQLSYANYFTVGTLEIITPPNNSETIINTSTSSAGTPILDVGTINISGQGGQRVNINASGQIGAILVHGHDATTTQLNLGGGSHDTSHGALQVGSIQLVGCYHPDYLVAPTSLSLGERYTRVGSIDAIHDGNRTSGSLIRITNLLVSSYFMVGDVSVKGDGVEQIVSNASSGYPVLRHTMTPQRATYYGDSSSWSPQNRYPATPGAMVTSALDGTVWVKRSGDSYTGWEALN